MEVQTCTFLNLPIYQKPPTLQNARSKVCAKSVFCKITHVPRVVPATIWLHASGDLPGGACTRNCAIRHAHGSRYLPHTQFQKATNVPQVWEECTYQTRFFSKPTSSTKSISIVEVQTSTSLNLRIYQESPTLGNARSKVWAKSKFYSLSAIYQSSTCNTRVACQRQSTRRCLCSKWHHATCSWISLSTAHTISKSNKSASGIGRVKIPDKVSLQTIKFDKKRKYCGGANLHLSESANRPGAPNGQKCKKQGVCKIRVLQKLPKVQKQYLQH